MKDKLQRVLEPERTPRPRWDAATEAWLVKDRAYWRRTALPELTARAMDVADILEHVRPISIAELHQVWLAAYEDMTLYMCSSLHDEAKRDEIRRQLYERSDAMTALMKRLRAQEEKAHAKATN